VCGGRYLPGHPHTVYVRREGLSGFSEDGEVSRVATKINAKVILRIFEYLIYLLNAKYALFQIVFLVI